MGGALLNLIIALTNKFENSYTGILYCPLVHREAEDRFILLLHIEMLLILLASQVSCEALRIKRPQVRILLGAPQTVDVLRAVGGFSFVVSKQFFLILLDFLNLTSRSAPSCQEGAPRLFSLWSRSILVVLIKMGDLAQIMAQNLLRGCRFSLVLPVFFRTSLWHRLGTNRLIPP